MSLFSLDKPIIDANIYEIMDEYTYASKNFSAILLLQGSASIHRVSHNPRDFILLPPGQQLTLCPENECVIGIIRFSNRILLSVLENPGWFDQPNSSITNTAFTEFYSILENIFSQFSQGLNATMASLYFSLADRMNLLLPKAEDKYLANATGKGKQILEYINENLSANLSLNDTASAVDLTPQYLSAFFQKTIGITFKEYQNTIKVPLCIPFLKYTDMTDSAIAGSIGFASEASMQKAFINTLGESVDSYRAQNVLSFEEHLLPEENIISNITDYIKPSATQLQDATPVSSHLTTQKVSVNAPQAPLDIVPDSWRKILNIGNAKYMVNPELRKQLQRLQESMHFIYGRMTGLLELTTMHEINGEIFYGFEGVFQILDMIKEIHLIPFITIESNYQKLLRVLPPFIRSCCNRYGLADISTWHFEICYDTEGAGNSRQTLWNYCNSFRKIEGIIHEYCPDCRVGGPGINTQYPTRDFDSILKNFKSEKTRIDFVSFYAYSTEVKESEISLPSTAALILERTTKATNAIKEIYPDLPIYVTEFNIASNIQCYLNDYVFNACFILWYLLPNLFLVDGFGYNRLSDIGDNSANTSDLLFGESGIYNVYGIPKPAYYSFYFLKNLGPIIAQQSSGVLVTMRNKTSYQALLFHCPTLTDVAMKSPRNEMLLESDAYAFMPLAPKSIELSINDVIPGQYLIKEYRINRSSGNILREYSHVHGIADLSEADIECFQYLSNPSAKVSLHSVTAGEPLYTQFIIHPLEVIMLQIDYNNKGESNEL